MLNFNNKADRDLVKKLIDTLSNDKELLCFSTSLLLFKTMGDIKYAQISFLHKGCDNIVYDIIIYPKCIKVYDVCCLTKLRKNVFLETTTKMLRDEECSLKEYSNIIKSIIILLCN